MSGREPPYSKAEYIDESNASLGVSEVTFARLDPARRDHILRRVAEWRLLVQSGLSIKPGNEDAARELFLEMLHVIRLLMSDHLARRPWYLRLLGFK